MIVDPTVFNFWEALFWFLLAFGCLLGRSFLSVSYRNWLLFSAANLFLFGITDVVEIYTGGFLHTAHWLLYWKTLHVIGLIVSVGWYIRLRTQ